MTFLLHILRKDLRALRWDLTGVLAGTAVFAHTERHSYDPVPGAINGILNSILPIAWAYLLGRAVLLERDWRTRPVPPTCLLAAKFAFALVAIHLPVLLTDLWVLTSHGFHLADSIVALWRKQASVGAWITLPSLALAASLRKFRYFAAGCLIAGSIFVWLLGGVDMVVPWRPSDPLRDTLGAGALALGSAIALWLAYRRTPGDRAALPVFALATIALCTVYYLPLRLTWTAGCRANSDRPFTLAPQRGKTQLQQPVGTLLAAAVPVSVMVLRTPEVYLLDGTLRNAAGHEEHLPSGMSTFRLRRLPEKIWGLDPAREYLWVRLAPALWQRYSTDPVDLHGLALARWSHETVAEETTVDSPWHDIAGVGRCRAERVTLNRGVLPIAYPAVKVSCESVRAIAPLLPVRLTTADGHVEKGQLGNSQPRLQYPTRRFLSPLYRQTTFFYTPDIQSATLHNARVEISRREDEGCEVLRIDLPRITLADWQVMPPTRP